jgi:hypothetical protein
MKPFDMPYHYPSTTCYSQVSYESSTKSWGWLRQAFFELQRGEFHADVETVKNIRPLDLKIDPE